MANKTYYKTDVAQGYFPHLRPSQALRQLKRKIHSRPALEEELMSICYRHDDRSSTFTEKEVAVIQKYLGRWSEDA